ncbi:MAG: hypothetical protein ACJ07L_13930, partial [Opitutales bacterium]
TKAQELDMRPALSDHPSGRLIVIGRSHTRYSSIQAEILYNFNPNYSKKTATLELLLTST